MVAAPPEACLRAHPHVPASQGANTESLQLTQQSAESVTRMKGCSVCLRGGVADQITADQAPRCCLALSDRS